MEKEHYFLVGHSNIRIRGVELEGQARADIY